ncbi:MAG: PD40 domain-containing protein [Bacteroidetes bacterium]|nr:PD40 domain-containing protein [Bacteroidota bacterium]
MIKKITFLVCFIIGAIQPSFSQTINRTLIKADKLFIKQEFTEAAKGYERYLKSFPKDYYASRQAAICYKKTNNQNQAIDHWPNVIESSKVTDADRLDYAKCLLANYRTQDARMMINFLKTSPDKAIAAWGLAYLNTSQFYMDSAITKVKELTGINTIASEDCPLISNNKLIFISEKNKTSKVFTASVNANKSTLLTATKKDDSSFSDEQSFAKHIQNKGISGQVSLSADESLMYYSRSASLKEMNKVGESGIYKFQIYSANPHAEKAEVSTPFIHNSSEYDYLHPSMSKDGLKLYFASNMKGTLGGMDIFVCEFINGAWSSPKNLGVLINTPGDEVFPHITEEGVLYYASDSRPGLGGLDIFYAEPNKDDGSFFTAKNAGAPINSQFDDYGIYILKGGNNGYFSSNRKNNLQDNDIYYFVKEKP